MVWKHTYEKMLEKAYKALPEAGKKTTRFEIPQVTGSLQGKRTMVTNLAQIATKLGRPQTHLLKFLLRELATTGNIDKDRTIFVGKFPSRLLNEKVDKYVKEFVLCDQCSKPDTKLIRERGIAFKQCEACGAKATVRTIK